MTFRIPRFFYEYVKGRYYSNVYTTDLLNTQEILVQIKLNRKRAYYYYAKVISKN